jgi:hypothetical protein
MLGGSMTMAELTSLRPCCHEAALLLKLLATIAKPVPFLYSL